MHANLNSETAVYGHFCLFAYRVLLFIGCTFDHLTSYVIENVIVCMYVRVCFIARGPLKNGPEHCHRKYFSLDSSILKQSN